VITQERLKELLSYDPETGVFTWRVRRGGKATVGAKAGNIETCNKKSGKNTTYIRILIDGKKYKAHSLVYLYTKGYLPKEIDHIDTNGINNRLLNLRECTRSNNEWNKGIMSRNSTGVKGVCMSRNRFRAQITCEGKRLGKNFLTIEEARDWRHEKALELHGEFARFA
jgi:hypothetical protein